ncbi:hypothetical protein P389DRAFT_54654 [Cystobasidium minutum MCA 4210]|uniref:uncharacterized protein n=1 Tax=Cystobasidium minutum MCA 4210 TaxID=1397322 RepID=UPI0034CF9033|eukprot:jgi/Rhomi1/54654/CE54653_439
MAAPDTIFKATYSSVPVYEMPCKGVAVMKRRSDGWLNATQILKVAGFDKPQRTRVLEREVQKGTHEKVQGGYGKYQGTWIPPDLGLALATQYGVENLLKPIIDYVPPKGGSPPPAPKHVTAAPRGPRQKRTSTPAGSTPRTNSMPPPPLSAGTVASVGTTSVGRTPPTSARSSTAGGRAGNAAASTSAASAKRNEARQLQAQQQAAAAAQAQAQAQAQQQHLLHQQQMQHQQQQHHQLQRQHSYYAESQLSQVEQYDDSAGATSPPLSPSSETSRTPSPLASEGASEYSQYPPHMQQQQPQRRKRKHRDSTMGMEDQQQQMQHQQGMQMQQQQQGQAATAGGPAAYARAILDYYISESASIPSFLISPPADFDPNVVIDDDGHTALHWACAMGRLRIVKLLLTAGADIFRANAIGQTALMRSVMFTNNYDLRKFPEMFELLHRSTINIDRTDRTVFHYAVDLALTKNKPHASKYYLEVLLDRLKEYPKEVADILNFQDEEGETALTLAARARFKSLVKILLNHGADPKIANRDGKSAEDYILEDERYRHQDGLDSSASNNANVINTGVPSQQQHMQYQQSLPPPIMVQQQMEAPQGQGMPPQRLDSSRGMPGGYPQQQGQPQTVIVQPNGYYPDGQSAVPVQGVLPPMVSSAAVQTIPLPLHYSETGQRITNQLIPQMNQQFEVLASTYDTELEAKERDISQAHSLLASIQAEAVEHAKLVNMLKAQADQLEEVQAKEEEMRSELKDKMGKRFRLGWEKYVRDEEDRQKNYVTITKNTNNGVKPIHQYSIELNDANASTGKVNGRESPRKQAATAQETPADISFIFSSLPTTTDDLSSEIKSNVEKLDQLKTQRKELFDSLIKLQAEAGGEKINEYRKLIALGCGISSDEVTPEFVKSVLEQLDNGDDLALAQMLAEGGANVEDTVAE